jgi:prostaglandin-endoperoxide synthase 2
MADKRRDAMYRFSNALQRFVNTNFGMAWRVVQRIGPLEKVVNRLLVNSGVDNLPARPYALSTRQDYTSWDALLDKTYNARQLPPTEHRRTSPDARAVLTLFARDEFLESPKSTVLFAYVAQWFTDGFLRSDRSVNKPKRDIRRNESTHEVDMAQLYGLTTAITDMLRDRSDRALLAHQVVGGEEYPPNLFDDHGERVEQFKDLPVIGIDRPGVDKTQLLAMGSDTSNTQIGYAMINTLFLREHNRIAREIRGANPSWDADRVFAAARCTLTVVLIKLLIEEYINHISPYHFQFRFDPRGFDKQPWMRPNRVAVEFNLLYRWHNLIPPTFRIGGQDLPLEATTMFKTKALLTGHGLGALYESASRQASGRICSRNTAPWFLDRVELPSIEAGRDVRLRGFNDYRQQCKFPRAATFEDISSDPQISARLAELYRDPDDVEFFVGLFAEDVPKGYIMPPLMNRMLAIHAFSQLMTNPLLAPQVYGEHTFSARGMRTIEETKSLKQVLQRNVPAGSPDWFVSLTREDYERGPDRHAFDG